MAELPELPEVQELLSEEHKRDAYGRRIAVATVVTTLVAASIAFLQASALRSHDQADQRAEKLGALAVNSAAGQHDLAQLQVDRFALYEDALTRARDASVIAQSGTGTVKRTGRLDELRWSEVARFTNAATQRMARDDGLPAITEQGPFGPEQDPSYPARYLERGQHRSYELFALREAANEKADAAESRFVHYAASLTMFAVAVFLFGYSLTPQGRAHRLLFSRAATGFVAFAAIWALITALRPGHEGAAQAATAFADGKVALNTSDYATAVRRFDDSIRMQPGFAEPYIQRAEARIATGQAALPSEEPVPGAKVLDQAAKDDMSALRLGSDSAALLKDLGNAQLYLGLLRNDDALLRDSIGHSAESAHRLSGQESTLYNVGEAKLALGLTAEARADFRAAEARTMRRTYTAREPIVASVLTDLALIRDRRPSTAREIDRLAAELVVTGSTGSGTADNTQTPRGMSPRRPTLIKLHVNLDPGHPEFQIDKSRGLDPNKDRVSAQWYYRGAGIPFWTALSSVSGPVEDDVNFVSTPYYTSPAYLAGTTPPQCLPQGTYRVDVYANGRFAGRAEAHTDWSGVKPIRLRDLGVGTCVEQQLRPLKQGIRSAVRVFLGPGGKTGMAVIALPPVLAAGSSVSSLARLAVHSFAPGTGLFRRLKLTSEASVNFMNLKSPEMQNWAYSGGNLVVGAGRAPDGRAYVAMAWAPDDGTRGTRTIFSFSQF